MFIDNNDIPESRNRLREKILEKVDHAYLLGVQCGRAQTKPDLDKEFFDKRLNDIKESVEICFDCFKSNIVKEL